MPAMTETAPTIHIPPEDTASGTMSAIFAQIAKTTGECAEVLAQFSQIDGWEGLADEAFAQSILADIKTLNAIAEPSQHVSTIMTGEQVDIDKALMTAKGNQISKQDQVAAVVARDTGKMSAKEFGQLRDYRDAADEAYAAAILAHERDTTTTSGKIGELDLPQGDEKSPGDDGGDGPLGKKHDGDDGGRGDDGSRTGGTDEDPKPEDPQPTTAAPTDTAPSAPSTTATPTTTNPVGDTNPAATTNLSTDASAPTNMSALSTNPSAAGATSQVPVGGGVTPTGFTSGSLSSNPANNPAARQQKKQEMTTQENLGKLFDATSGVAAGAVMGAPDHAGTPPTTNPAAGVPAGGQPTPQPTAVDRIAAAQQQQQAQQVAAGGLGSGAGLKAAQGGIGSEPKKPPNIPAADKPNDDPKPTKNDDNVNKDGKQS